MTYLKPPLGYMGPLHLHLTPGGRLYTVVGFRHECASPWCQAVTFTIPGKITSANRVTRHVGRVALKSKSAREDHARIQALAFAATTLPIALWWGGHAVTIVAYNSRLDADNLPKTILDGIRGILIVNDSPKHLRRLVVEHRRDHVDRSERYEVAVAALE